VANQILEKYPHPKHPRLTIQRRTTSRFYQSLTFLDGQLKQHSLKTTHLPTAFKLAEDWYTRELRASVSFGLQHPIARLTTDPTMAELFASYCTALEPRKQPYAKEKWSAIAAFWRARLLSTINTDTFKEFFAWRRRSKIKNHTLHKDVVVIRQILKCAIEHELLGQLPRIPSVGTIEKNPRPWFTPSEWLHLNQVASERIQQASNIRTARQRQDALDMMNFLHASMLRIGELQGLRFHACRVERNVAGDKLLLCEVSGKRGTRTIVANAVAAVIYERRLRVATPADLIFPHSCRDGFREILIAAGLRENAQGFMRNRKSVRATSISTALLQNPELNLTVVARNAGTSIQMIDDFYAKRLTAEMNKDVLSALPAELSAALKVAEAEEEGKRQLKRVEQQVLDGLSPEARAAMLDRAAEEFVKKRGNS
jgi:hypothetical protein